jgi:alkyl hydroperoxide reductase subunit AhpF
MQVKLLNDEMSTRIKALFDAKVINPIELYYFTKKDQCDTCEDAFHLYVELAELSDVIKLSSFEIEEHTQLAQHYNVQNTPALVICAPVEGKTIDYGIRFLGIPSGYEFSSLIQAIGLVSRRDSGLKPETRKELEALQVPLQLKVFVTPT